MTCVSYKDKSKEKWFLVSWTLANKCNYRCSYCPSFLNDGSSGWPQWETVKDFVTNLKLPQKEICYRISGGEPTYWKRFPDLAKLIKQHGHTFSFLSNGSQSVDYYKNISQYTDGLILTWHNDYADLEHFKSIINSVSCPVVVNMMFSPENFDEAYKLSNQLFLSSDLVAIWPKIILDKNENSFTNNAGDFTSEQLEILEHWPFLRPIQDQKLHRGGLLLDGEEITANDLILTKKNHYKGWKCWGGLDGIGIDQWGDVYRSDCLYGGKLGNLEKYNLPDRPIICGRDKCTCLGDIYLRKESQN